jgi:hypothetical protein
MTHIPFVTSAILGTTLVCGAFGIAGCGSNGSEELAEQIQETTPKGNEPIIPFAQLPGPGECRIWFPGRSPLEQPSAGPCQEIDDKVPPGAWLVYRPAQTPQLIQIREYPVQPGGVVVVKNYDARTGAYLGPGES